MLLIKKIEGLGDIHGAIYDFEKSGDILEKHVHTEENNHITIVARGKIKAYSHDWEIIATPGQILDFRPNEPHEFVALENNTRIFNITKKYNSNLEQTQDY
jgi:quercetin dioxygenase-like cupin family protein